MEQVNTENRLYNKREAAKYLGCAEITVHRLLRSNQLGCFRIASKVLIGQSHLDDFLRRAERRPAQAA
jgi:excisionase family DNA binding protein